MQITHVAINLLDGSKRFVRQTLLSAMFVRNRAVSIDIVTGSPDGLLLVAVLTEPPD